MKKPNKICVKRIEIFSVKIWIRTFSYLCFFSYFIFRKLHEGIKIFEGEENQKKTIEHSNWVIGGLKEGIFNHSYWLSNLKLQEELYKQKCINILE